MSLFSRDYSYFKTRTDEKNSSLNDFYSTDVMDFPYSALACYFSGPRNGSVVLGHLAIGPTVLIQLLLNHMLLCSFLPKNVLPCSRNCN